MLLVNIHEGITTAICTIKKPQNNDISLSWECILSLNVKNINADFMRFYGSFVTSVLLVKNIQRAQRRFYHVFGLITIKKRSATEVTLPNVCKHHRTIYKQSASLVFQKDHVSLPASQM